MSDSGIIVRARRRHARVQVEPTLGRLLPLTGVASAMLLGFGGGYLVQR
jgi:hypothetical protein